MRITQKEHVALIEATDGANFVECKFGVNGVFLIDTPENKWAVEMVRDMRKEQPNTIFLTDEEQYINQHTEQNN